MSDNQLPTGPVDNSGRLPARGGHQSPAAYRPQAMPTTILEDARKDDSDEIDLLAYWYMLVKRRWLILGIVIVAVVVALVYTLLATPMYQASAVLEIKSDSIQVTQFQGMPRSYGGYDPGFRETQVGLLQSHSLAVWVAQDLNLASSDIFQRLRPPSWSERLRRLISPTQRDDVERTENQPDAAKKDPAASPPQAGEVARAAGIIAGGLVISPVEKSHLVYVSFRSPIPSFSARVANAVADGFIASSMDREFGASSYAKTYLEDQLKQLKSRLEQSERELVQFAQKENIVQPTDGKSLVGQNLADLNTSLAAAQSQRIRAQARWNEAKSVTGALPADMLNNSIVSTLQQQRAELQGQYQQKLPVFKPDYPEMLSLKSRIDEVDKQIKAALANIRASVKAEYDAAASQEHMLVEQIDELRKETLDVDSRSIQYNILKRDVDTNRQLYDGLLQRYKEVGIAAGAKTSNISIIDRAGVPGAPYRPNLSQNLMVALLAGLLLGIMLALVKEYLDDTLKTPKDIESHLHLAVLGIVPKLVKQTPRDALKDLRSAFAESYRSVRTALQFSTERGVPNVLLVTSPGPGEGKSTSAITLAYNFAKLGKRVLLIEGDLRNPSLGKTMGLSAETGLSSLLAGAATLAESVRKTEDPHLDVILSGPLPPSPTELLSGHKLVSLLTAGAEKYDQIIIDGPPVLGIADAPILANIAAGTLLVILSGKTRIATAQASVKRLRATRARIIGCLLTQYDAKAAGYGYSYEATYTYGATPRLKGR